MLNVIVTVWVLQLRKGYLFKQNFTDFLTDPLNNLI